MDFEKTLTMIIKDFDQEKIQYALIGGFALASIGIIRATYDLDFLINFDDLSKLKNILKKYSYKCIYESENVSQYVSDLKIFGRLDFLHAFRSKSILMLKRAKKFKFFEKKLTLKVLNPEDIIGLKLQALVNDSERKNKEFSDIEAIMDLLKNKLDWNLIKEYFEIFNKNKEFTKLKKKYDKIK